jgi:ryanodine receptor 2
MTLQDLLGGEAAKAAEKERSEAQKVQEAAMASIESEGRKSTQTTTEPAAVNQIDFSQYAHKAVSFLARNFYNLKYVALVLAFCINFMLLFYKVTTFGEENSDGSGDSELNNLDMSGSGAGGVELGSAEGSGESEADDDPLELVQVDEVYIEHVMRFAALMHSIVSLCMLIAYYHLKVPLAIFKREKEIARRLEFDGLFIAEQPEDDDIKSHWDKLVISSKR